MNSHTANVYPSQPVRVPDAEQDRTGAAFRATFWATVSVLALVFSLSLAHGEAPRSDPQPVSETYGWPV